MKKCSICKEEYAGYGNNAEPVNTGRCCDSCNSSVVIPVRIGAIGDVFTKAMMNSNINKINKDGK
jgi:hypothetical protein